MLCSGLITADLLLYCLLALNGNDNPQRLGPFLSGLALASSMAFYCHVRGSQENLMDEHPILIVISHAALVDLS